MSHSHTQERKMIRRFKEKFGKDKWYAKFAEHTARIAAERLGPPLGTLEEIVNTMGRGPETGAIPTE